MKKALFILVLTCILVFLLSGQITAGEPEVLRYSDTGAVSVGDFSIFYWYPPDGGGEDSLIRNGDFQAWIEGQPAQWTLWADSKPGWEDAHVAQMDYAVSPEGENLALGLFLHNTGGEGEYYAGAYQQLDLLPQADHYWITTHVTMWGKGSTIPYNSVAWYGIGATADPASVAQWRELSPQPYPCPNALGACIHVGRYETLYLEPGQYFHLRVAQHFPVVGAWTVFGLDDFSIVPAGGTLIEDGFWPDALVTWDPRVER